MFFKYNPENLQQNIPNETLEVELKDLYTANRGIFEENPLHTASNFYFDNNEDNNQENIPLEGSEDISNDDNIEIRRQRYINE